MFNSKKRIYTRQSKIQSTNQYNEKIEGYTAATDVLMYISLSNESLLKSNDMRIQQCSHIGLTKDTVLVGDLIDDGKLEVQFINSAGKEKIVFMKEIENNGSFN